MISGAVSREDNTERSYCFSCQTQMCLVLPVAAVHTNEEGYQERNATYMLRIADLPYHT